MELEKIEQQIRELEANRKEILDSQRASVLAEVKKHVKTFGFTASELGINASGEVVAAAEEQATKTRRAKGEKAAEDLAKRENMLAKARLAFETKQVRKFTNPETGVAKYHWNGKKGLMPKGEGAVVKAIEEIV